MNQIDEVFVETDGKIRIDKIEYSEKDKINDNKSHNGKLITRIVVSPNDKYHVSEFWDSITEECREKRLRNLLRRIKFS
jgi:hypothetical protein